MIRIIRLIISTNLFCYPNKYISQVQFQLFFNSIQTSDYILKYRKQILLNRLNLINFICEY